MGKLRFALGANAASCFGFGLFFALWPSDIAAWLGVEQAMLVRFTGVLLLINGAGLAVASILRSIPNWVVAFFSAGDLLWFTATLYALALQAPITTRHGQIAALGLGLAVCAIGVAQVSAASALPNFWDSKRGPDRADHLAPGISRTRAIARSWLSMKRAVLAWLFLFNLIMLASVFQLQTIEGRMIVAAYVASGPWLAVIAIAQRGLTRLLGLAHLIPFLPLLAFMTSRGTGLGGQPEMNAGLFWLTLAVLAACLALDARDVWRWFAGETFRLGSRNAFKKAASRLASP
jgi:hypothetical protein